MQIGDIHLAPWQKRKQVFLKKLAKEDIDLVINTGDNLGHQQAIPLLLDALAPLLGKPGVFVHGSNDYFGPVPKNPFSYLRSSPVSPIAPTLETEKLTQGFEDAGWLNLNNGYAELEVAGNRLSFTGVDDYHIGKSELASIRSGTGMLIAVTHAPYLAVLERFSEVGAKLVFAGHTHGGQVRLPFIGSLTTNCDLPNKHSRGKSQIELPHGKLWLSVVAGLGNSIYAPIRFFCLPEVRIVTLSAID